MGGEKYLPCFNADGFVGSPPALAGKSREIPLHLRAAKDHPAWAGKSRKRRKKKEMSWDRPAWAGKRLIDSLSRQLT